MRITFNPETNGVNAANGVNQGGTTSTTGSTDTVKIVRGDGSEGTNVDETEEATNENAKNIINNLDCSQDEKKILMSLYKSGKISPEEIFSASQKDGGIGKLIEKHKENISTDNSVKITGNNNTVVQNITNVINAVKQAFESSDPNTKTDIPDTPTQTNSIDEYEKMDLPQLTTMLADKEKALDDAINASGKAPDNGLWQQKEDLSKKLEANGSDSAKAFLAAEEKLDGKDGKPGINGQIIEIGNTIATKQQELSQLKSQSGNTEGEGQQGNEQNGANQAQIQAIEAEIQQLQQTQAQLQTEQQKAEQERIDAQNAIKEQDKALGEQMEAYSQAREDYGKADAAAREKANNNEEILNLRQDISNIKAAIAKKNGKEYSVTNEMETMKQSILEQRKAKYEQEARIDQKLTDANDIKKYVDEKLAEDELKDNENLAKLQNNN